MALSSFVLAECVKMTSISSLCGIIVILLYSPIAYTCGKFLGTVLHKYTPNTVKEDNNIAFDVHNRGGQNTGVEYVLYQTPAAFGRSVK